MALSVLCCLVVLILQFVEIYTRKTKQRIEKMWLANLMNNSASHNNNRGKDDDGINVHTTLKLDSLRLINWLAFISCEHGGERRMNLSTE